MALTKTNSTISTTPPTDEQEDQTTMATPTTPLSSPPPSQARWWKPSEPSTLEAIISSNPSPLPPPSPPLDPALEHHIIRTLDLTLVPLLCILFTISFADRANIGNAKIAGMTQDLHLHGNRYNLAVMVFTTAYMVFGIPASLVFKRFGTRCLSAMMGIWGCFALGQGFVRGFGEWYPG